MTLTISLPVLILLGISVALFIGVTVFCHRGGMFDGGGGYCAGLDGLFIIGAYLILWALPSLIGWAVWATWLR